MKLTKKQKKVYNWLKENKNEMTTIENIHKKSGYGMRDVATTIQILIEHKILKVNNDATWDELFEKTK